MNLVIVGAGTSGAVIAARATETSGNEVTLLEAGPDYPGDLPPDLRDGKTNSMRRHDWGYRHAPNPSSPRFYYPRGKVVGGSSAVNTCIALRGQARDYDEWAELGLPDWSFERCLPALRRLERDVDFGDRPEHGEDGPVPIRRHPPPELTPWSRAFFAAARALGHPECEDHNAEAPIGVGPHPMNKIDGERMSVARCYLTPLVRARENLTIRPNTLVRRVLFENRSVRGLEVEVLGVVRELRASSVVLAAGAIHTPGILLRSGIGPRRDVERLGVDLLQDVPAVGRRLLDHPGVALFYWPLDRALVRRDDPILQVLLRATSSGSDYPGDLQLQAGSGMPTPLIYLPAVTLMAHVGKPRGHGELRWESANPHAPPRILSNLLQDPHDLAVALEAATLLRDLGETAEIRAFARPVWPRESVRKDREALSRYISRTNDSGYHPCGTVPMGPCGSPEAAVDGQGRVRGVSGLFVADASLMPTIPAVNTNIPTLMIGERFGEWFRSGSLASG